jgi:hypothetical protein
VQKLFVRRQRLEVAFHQPLVERQSDPRLSINTIGSMSYTLEITYPAESDFGVDVVQMLELRDNISVGHRSQHRPEMLRTGIYMRVQFT